VKDMCYRLLQFGCFFKILLLFYGAHDAVFRVVPHQFRAEVAEIENLLKKWLVMAFVQKLLHKNRFVVKMYVMYVDDLLDGGIFTWSIPSNDRYVWRNHKLELEYNCKSGFKLLFLQKYKNIPETCESNEKKNYFYFRLLTMSD